MVTMSLIAGVFGALSIVLMSLLLDLVSPLDIPCKKIYGLETLFYDHRSFQSAFVSNFKIRMHSSLFRLTVALLVYWMIDLPIESLGGVLHM